MTSCAAGSGRFALPSRERSGFAWRSRSTNSSASAFERLSYPLSPEATWITCQRDPFSAIIRGGCSVRVSVAPSPSTGSTAGTTFEGTIAQSP